MLLEIGQIFILKKIKKSKGFTLIEILLVVGFIALAGIGVYIVYDKVTTSQSVNAEVRNLDTLRAGIKNIYAASSNYGTAGEIITPIIINAKVAPDIMVNGTALRSGFGGAVTIAVAGLGTGMTNNAFNITYSGITADVCSKFVTIAANSFNKVTIGGAPVKDTSSTGNALNVERTTQYCALGSGTPATIVFTSL